MICRAASATVSSMDALAAGMSLVLVMLQVRGDDVAGAVSINVVIDDRGARACRR